MVEEQHSVTHQGQSSRKTNQTVISKEKRLEPLNNGVSEKLEEEDFKGAVRLASSDDRLASYSKEILDTLLSKHPAPPPDSMIPPHFTPETMHKADMICAVKALPNDSAGGLSCILNT